MAAHSGAWGTAQIVLAGNINPIVQRCESEIEPCLGVVKSAGAFETIDAVEAW